jgi:uncharacterized protein YgiM (DUF1202 family)
VRKLDPLARKDWIDLEDVPTICGHRDVNSTECPGDVLWSDLPYIREAVDEVVGDVVDPGIPGEFRIGQEIVVTVNDANVRTGPGLNYGSVRTLSSGTRGTVTDGPVTNDGYTWYEIRTSAGTGWMATITFGAAAKPPGAFKKGDTVVVDTDLLSLRSRAGQSSTVIATMPQGTQLTITYAYNRVDGMEWYKVTGSYGDGWVAGQYLAKSKPPGQWRTGDLVEVGTDLLSLRSRAGLSGSVIATMPEGTDLRITYAYNRVDGMEWYKVTGSYGDGWVAGQYLRARTSSGGPKPIKINYTVYVNDGPVNMRTSPSTGASVVAVLPQDAKLQVVDGPATGSGYTWWKLRSSKWGTGWVVADFIGRR